MHFGKLPGEKGGVVTSRRRYVVRSLGPAVGAASLVAGLARSAGAPVSAAPPSTPGITAKTVTVGSISDISSPAAGLFAGAKTGTEAYFAYVNSQGGVNGRKLILD